MEQIPNDYLPFLNDLGELASKGTVVNDGSYLLVELESAEDVKLSLNRIKEHKSEVSNYIKIGDGDTDRYSVNFNKLILKKSGAHFFSSEERFNDWLLTIDPFQADNFFNQSDSGKQIFVYGLDKAYTGPKLSIQPTTESKAKTEFIGFELPSNESIRQNTFVINSNFLISPNHYTCEFDQENSWSLNLLKYSVLVQAVCMVQEIPNAKEVIVRGVKKSTFKLDTDDLSFDKLKELQAGLGHVIHWCFEERTHTRLKLIADRLSLELDPKHSFLNGLSAHLKFAFEDAKERYGFIITERSDEYNRQLRNLQSQILDRTKNYTEKLRSLLSGVLRDVLAAVFLVAFGLIVKSGFEDPKQLIENHTIILLLKGLAMYFLVSLILQFSIHIPDVILSKKELINFAITTRDYLREDQIRSMVNTALKKREWFFGILYSLITLIYVSLILTCWNMEWIFNN